MSRWLLFVGVFLIAGCGKSGPSSADYQAELAALDRLEKDLSQLDAEWKTRFADRDLHIEQLQADLKLAESVGTNNAADLRRTIGELQIDFSLAKEADKSRQPILEKIRLQRARIEEIERRRRSSN